ncbi:MAG: hypothetical protein ACE363_14230 [Alphaproteobacteria bacterium]
MTDDFSGYKAHVLARIAESAIDKQPFYHLCVADILPQRLYTALAATARGIEREAAGMPVPSNPRRTEHFRDMLGTRRDADVDLLYRLFSDHEIKTSLLERFYQENTGHLAGLLTLDHVRFGFTTSPPEGYTEVHLDVPPKYLSFVFYFPGENVETPDQGMNGTVLYDASLTPHYKVPFKANSGFVFAPHFHSYHAYLPTIRRTAFVMSYARRRDNVLWRLVERARCDRPPFFVFKWMVQRKLTAHPLKEYGSDAKAVSRARAACLVDGATGRVFAPGAAP